MTRDYASRSTGRRKQGARKKSPARRASGASRASSEKRSIWSAPSFSAGAIFGAALVLLAGYAPDAFKDTVVAVREPVTETQQIEFDFEEILENDSVRIDPNAYEAEFPGEDPDAPQPVYEIQAISVRSAETAQELSTEVIGMGLNARYERVDLSSGTWYRVMVGPYNSRREADRVMNRLRDRKMLPSLRTVR